LGGAVAIEAMDGPVIPWKSGRSDVDAKIAQAQPEKVFVVLMLGYYSI
jgi:catalase (peroxidase I)